MAYWEEGHIDALVLKNIANGRSGLALLWEVFAGAKFIARYKYEQTN